MLKHQRCLGVLSFKQIFPICSNTFLNSAFYLITPFIVPFILIYKLVIILLQKPSITRCHSCCERLFVNNNSRFYSRTKAQLNENDVILNFQTSLNVDGFRNVKISELVNVGDVLRASSYAIQSLWYLSKNYGYWSCIYALNAFDCYLLMIALDNLSVDVILVTDAQIDRLAYIIDSAKQAKKEIIMHGSLLIHGRPQLFLLPYVVYNSETIEWCYNMPVRLKKISKVYSFTQKEGDYFKLSAMTPDSSPLIVEVGYGTKFSKISKSTHQLDILLVADDKMLLYEIKMCHLFFQNGYRVFIQRHPLSDRSEYESIANQGIAKIVEASQINPLVDLVVSYGSTLAHEYEVIDIPVIYYTDYIENSDLNEIELIKAINKYEK